MGYVDDYCGGYENLALHGWDLQAAYESQLEGYDLGGGGFPCSDDEFEGSDVGGDSGDGSDFADDYDESVESDEQDSESEWKHPSPRRKRIRFSERDLYKNLYMKADGICSPDLYLGRIVELTAIQNQPELNGRLGRIVKLPPSQTNPASSAEAEVRAKQAPLVQNGRVGIEILEGLEQVSSNVISAPRSTCSSSDTPVAAADTNDGDMIPKSIVGQTMCENMVAKRMVSLKLSHLKAVPHAGMSAHVGFEPPEKLLENYSGFMSVDIEQQLIPGMLNAYCPHGAKLNSACKMGGIALTFEALGDGDEESGEMTDARLQEDKLGGKLDGAERIYMFSSLPLDEHCNHETDLLHPIVLEFPRPSGGWNARYLIDCVEKVDTMQRPKSVWLGGIDSHHTYFEGLTFDEQKGAYRAGWGS